jgi:hypothetical protein
MNDRIGKQGCLYSFLLLVKSQGSWGLIRRGGHKDKWGKMILISLWIKFAHNIVCENKQTRIILTREGTSTVGNP